MQQKVCENVNLCYSQKLTLTLCLDVDKDDSMNKCQSIAEYFDFPPGLKASKMCIVSNLYSMVAMYLSYENGKYEFKYTPIETNETMMVIKLVYLLCCPLDDVISSSKNTTSTGKAKQQVNPVTDNANTTSNMTNDDVLDDVESAEFSKQQRPQNSSFYFNRKRNSLQVPSLVEVNNQEEEDGVSDISDEEGYYEEGTDGMKPEEDDDQPHRQDDDQAEVRNMGYLNYTNVDKPVMQPRMGLITTH